MQIDNVE